MPMYMVKDLVLFFIYVKIIIAKLFLSDLKKGFLHFLIVYGVYFHSVLWITSPDTHGKKAAHAVYNDPSRVGFIISMNFNF